MVIGTENTGPRRKLEIGESAFRGCFGCGDENDRSLALAFALEGDCVVSHTEISPDYAGYPDFVHGGVVATVLDEAMGWAMLHLARRHGVTRGLNIRYRRPVPIGRRLTIQGRVVEIGDRTVTLYASIEDERGRLLASAEGDWVVVRGERARRPAAKD